jgi:putative holliday junction resolvase
MLTLSEFREKLKPHQRLLGLDVGEKTIGLALSDLTRTVATPHSTIDRVKFTKDVEHLKKIILEHEVAGLVLGYPLNMDGTEGPRCQSIRQFATNVEKHKPLPTLLWDERMSTLAVERMMIEADLSRARRAVLVDKLAASYILQGALDSLKAIGIRP